MSEGWQKGFEVLQKFNARIRVMRQQLNSWLKEMGIESSDLAVMESSDFRSILEGIIDEVSQNLYENTKLVVDHNSQYGWTLASEMALLTYIDDELLTKSKEELDNYFFNYYSDDNWYEYECLKNAITKQIRPQWNELIDDCFFLFENHRYKSAIPIIFTILEGELSLTLGSEEVGFRLVKKIEKEATDAEAKFRKILLYSILGCFRKALFVRHEFTEERKPVINRHWVLHGRDNPELWEKVDVLRLLTVLNSIQFLQTINAN